VRALILRGPHTAMPNGATLHIADLPDPTPAEGEVVVRVSVCGFAERISTWWKDG
jgi:hypothetical protein